MPRRLLIAVAMLAILGCKGPLSTTAASTGEASAADAQASSGGVQTLEIHDPTLDNRAAFAVAYPAHWHIQGTLFQGDACQQIPSPVFRATSGDGRSFVEQMPPMVWRWGSGPMVGNGPQNNCLPLKSQVSAEEFLRYLAGVLGVQYVGPAPVPEELNAKAQSVKQSGEAAYAGSYSAMRMQPPKNTRELARAIVTFKNGSTQMKGRLHVLLDCMEMRLPGGTRLGAFTPGRPPQMVKNADSVLDKCSAVTQFVAAPESEFARIESQWDQTGTVPRSQDEWVHAWLARSNEQGRQQIDAIRRAGERSSQMLHEQYEQNMAMSQRMHQDFMDSMQRGTNMSMAATQRSMNARGTATSDWVDYSLDRQTVLDTNTGLVHKIPNQVTVEQPLEKLHGDGTPY